MTIRSILGAGAGAVLFALTSSPVQAQPLGTFAWQLQPFCNRVVVSVTQNGGIYTIDGYDDQCGAPQRAPLVGLATPNPDGSVGFGLHIVTVPGGRAVQVDARIPFPSLTGTWTDSAGNSGTFALNGAAAGAARPAPTVSGTVITAGTLPATSITNNSITSTQIQNNTVTSADTQNEPGVTFSFNSSAVPLAGAFSSVLATSMRVPADGYVKIEVTGSWNNTANVENRATCQLQKGPATAIDDTQPLFYLRERVPEGFFDSFAAHRIVPVAVADNPLNVLSGQSFRLVCALSLGTIAISDAHISATYYATSYAPAGLAIPLPFDTTPPPPQQ